MSALAQALTEQAGHCAALGSPFMERLCLLLARRLRPGTPLTDRLFDWTGDIGPKGQSVPLRLCGGFHALRLLDRAGLADVYPPHETSDDALWSAIENAMHREAVFLDDWLNNAPQTNEVRRSSVLIALGQSLHARFGLPIVTSELGASGGLNLRWDRYALAIETKTYGPENAALTLRPDWSGALPPEGAPQLAQRRGVDIGPLDPSDPEDRLRLLAYLWPDQPHRIELTKAAISEKQDVVDQGDAIDWLAERLDPKAGHLHLIYSTVAWQYFSATSQARGVALIEAAGDKASDDAPVAWFGMENDGGTRGAALTLRLWPGNTRLDLGRADFHGRWVEWTGALERLGKD
ncbi:DUF2332 domain-containing protein [Thalassococcus lentus]|uniref:DUF2332 family protein n=1 Tax=Thalassococcus lentus TaxID=1210524 RepID=A0ABT4XQ13_9RHOB|nr:DUF2332 family protein [Thalassococcus lentus]MDA7424042.1 DUF2332 family protein [Thalassococcus lentus]